VEVQPEVLPYSDSSVGIDLGISTFATLSNGQKIKAPKPLKKRIRKLKKLSKSLSRKTKGSKRHECSRKRLAKLHAKLADTRTDFLHKLSTKLLRENQTIVLEDLNV
jgi:putative transposase